MKLGSNSATADPKGVAYAHEAAGSASTRSGRRRPGARTRSRWRAGSRATTERIGIGTAIMQMPARTPTATAMYSSRCPTSSGGRVLLGLGNSGPQVVEGWHRRAVGEAASPHARVRRDRPHPPSGGTLSSTTRALRHPLREGATGLGKPLKLILKRSGAGADHLAALGQRTSRSRRRSPRAGCRSSLMATARSTARPSRTRRRASRSHRSGHRRRRRRGAAVPRHAEADARPLHRRHGRAGRTSTTRSRSATATRRPRRRSGPLPLGSKGEAAMASRRARRRDRARRAEGADRGAPRNRGEAGISTLIGRRARPRPSP